MAGPRAARCEGESVSGHGGIKIPERPRSRNGVARVYANSRVLAGGVGEDDLNSQSQGGDCATSLFGEHAADPSAAKTIRTPGGGE